MELSSSVETVKRKYTPGVMAKFHYEYSNSAGYWNMDEKDFISELHIVRMGQTAQMGEKHSAKANCLRNGLFVVYI